MLIKQDLDGLRTTLQKIARSAKELSIEPGDVARDLSSILRSIELMFSSLKFGEELFAYLALARSLEDMMELVESKLVPHLLLRSANRGANWRCDAPGLYERFDMDAGTSLGGIRLR